MTLKSVCKPLQLQKNSDSDQIIDKKLVTIALFLQNQ